MMTPSLQTEQVLLREDRDGVAILRLNRPKALNALNADLVAALTQELTRVAADASIHGVVLTGAGEKSFCAGADISAMQTLTPAEAAAWGRRGQALTNLLENHPKTIIAAVNGYALGGGLELAMACDWIMMVPEAKVGQPEVTIGVIPGFGGTQRLARLVGPHAAKWLCMTGESITGTDAQRLGLATHLVAKDQLLPEALRLLAKVRDAGPFAVRMAKQVIHRGAQMDLDGALTLELDAFALTFATHDQKEGMKAFLEKRKPAWTGR